MILSWKALRRGALVAAVVALLSSLMVASVSAQPPTPPNRFFGDVTLDGSPASAGTNVTATIGGNICGQTTVQADSTYVLDVVSSGQTAGCGTEGATVEFTVAGNSAGSAAWSSGQFTELDLVAEAAPVVTPVTPVVTPVTPTPEVVTGSGGYLDGGSGTAWWAYMAAGLALLLLGTAGVAAYRRYAR
jgi:opacity protein-like surface antigen